MQFLLSLSAIDLTDSKIREIFFLIVDDKNTSMLILKYSSSTGQ